MECKIEEYFKALRFNKNHHLELGDIRLTIAQQDEVVKFHLDKVIELTEERDVWKREWRSLKTALKMAEERIRELETGTSIPILRREGSPEPQGLVIYTLHEEIE